MTPRASLWVLSRGWIVPDKPYAVGLPLEAFKDKEAAEAVCARLERQAREQTPVGPSLKRLLPKRANDLVAAAQGAGLVPPDFSAVGPEVVLSPVGQRITNAHEYSAYNSRLKQAVEDWWALVSADLTPEANAKLWDLLFPDQTFYAVSRMLWEE